MPRQRKNQKSKAARADSGSEVEDIPRKTLMDQIGANLPHLENGVPFDLKQLQAPLAEALSKDQKKGGKITYESFNIPSALPDRSGPKNEFLKETGRKKGDDKEEEDDEDVEIGDLGQTFFFAVPLTMLLFAFYILVQKQYLEEMEYREAIGRTVKSFPVIWFILYLTHPRKALKAMQVGFVITAVVSGSWMIYNVNNNGYYAIMKMVPPLGTLLIYSMIEMDIIPAVSALAIIGVYTWYNDLVLFSV
ncbi:uncharacterized protein DFL_004768 [Arthrobotrys flagrans]|uniref:DUF7719 domain-containing protein n=1 Tax=Arthrobotrys flagrans TaxID=97331 RepID=A0A437A5V3_ARTFL|nr:hypothetical protein DFL_004768 [Arthrobotrys flagrans]